MANRNFKTDRGAFVKAVIDVYASVAIGATGAPTLSASGSQGVATIARNSAGKYTITLSDAYNALLQVGNTIKLASGVPSTASNLQMLVRSETVGSTKTVVIEFVKNDGTAAEIVSGATLLLHIQLKNSNV
jgi:acyl-coenzyme A synthetase/AMP-(fatty) acid ligase